MRAPRFRQPSRLASRFDLRTISFVEGIRAGLAAAVPVAASAWLHQPSLALAALGALLTCICDPAGPMRRRLPVMLIFIVCGGIMLGSFGLLRGYGVLPTVVGAAPCLFLCAYLRVWGQALQALGNLLSVVLLLGTDNALNIGSASNLAIVFMAGGAWALFLTVAIWRIHPYGPARRAVADAWSELARLTARIQTLAAAEHPPHAWEEAARTGRGAVREAIEHAREVLMDTLTARGASSGSAAQNLLRLEAGDQVFAALIALTDMLEQSGAEAAATALPLLRRLRALLIVLATAMEQERLRRLDRFERTLAALAADPTIDPALRPYATALADRLRLATKFLDPAQFLPGSGPRGEAGVPFRERFIGPLSANLNWRSVSLRHATRVTVVLTPVLAATLTWHGIITHWLTITLVLVMQPFFATTRQRTLERIGGTVLGGLIAGGLSTLLRSTLHVAGVLPVLGALALSVRQVSYAVYIAVYTPTVILLVENMHPAGPLWRLALLRAALTILGGLLAVAANLLLWPCWEPGRIRNDLDAALAAHAAYAAAVLNPAPGVDAEAARRAAGLASNNLEANLARAMQEPRRRQRDMLQNILVADAALRRIAGRLVALSLTGATRSAAATWTIDALAAMAAHRPPPSRPATNSSDMLDRLARQVAALPDVLARLGQE
jgi:uncharacterized membrane protein YccC